MSELVNQGNEQVIPHDYPMPVRFNDGVRTAFSELIADANGLSYLPWPTAIALANRPQIDVVTYDGLPYIAFFGGAVVAVEGMSGERKQRVWLPVMDAKHKSVSAESLDVRDINDAISRCRAKAVAMLHGVGLSLYAGYGGNNIAFLRDLGVKPTSDISQVEPLTANKPGKAGASYVDWVAAYTAAKITDPAFHFEVLKFHNVDMETGEEQLIPAQRVGNSWMVAVKLTYKGRDHVEWLPIMGQAEVMTKNGLKKLDHQPLLNPTTHDWNRAVMRCLTRGIAMLTGYGLSVYAKEDMMTLQRLNEQAANLTSEKPQLTVVQSSKPASTEAPAPVEINEVLIQPDDEVPEDHFLYAGPVISNEIDEATRKNVLMRIGAIDTLERIQAAKADIDSKYAGTGAYDLFISALRAKREELMNPTQLEDLEPAMEQEPSIEEPNELTCSKMLNRINAIRSLESIDVAKQQIDEAYFGTLAHAEFMRALTAKRNALRQANLAAA